MPRRKPLKYPFGEFSVLSVREPQPQQTVSDPASILRYWHAHIAPSPQMQLPDKEHVVVILRNTHDLTMGWHLVSMGTLNATCCHPREVLRPVIVGAAFSFLLLHNHPSGDPTPSMEDRSLTRIINEAAKIHRIELSDHLILGAGKTPYFSFKEHGLL